MPDAANVSFFEPSEGLDQFVVAMTAGERALDGFVTAPWNNLNGARANFEAAVRAALQNGGRYPIALAGVMSAHLGALQMRTVQLNPMSLRFTLQGDSWLLLPEMIPIDDVQPIDDAQPRWLDQLAPCYRVLSHEPAQARPPREMSLAIVYQSGDALSFGNWARGCLRGLAEAFDRVDLYPGSTLAGEAQVRLAALRAILRHRVVLFLGHMAAPDGLLRTGWQLTPNSRLTMTEIAEAIGSAPESMPELVLAGCCAGAWGDHAGGRQRRSFPDFFLQKGVRFFVGTWMNVIGPRATIGNTICGFAVDFLTRWAGQPDSAVHHLYQTKSAMGFPLVASLFQIYTTGSEPVAAPLPAPPRAPAMAENAAPAPVAAQPEIRPEPAGGLISGISPGGRLGPYKLGPQLWTEAYSRTFWANSQTGNHMVEVLTDEWQTVDMAAELDSAIAKLGGAGLGDRHLLPARREYCQIRIGETVRDVLVLVYDRPAGEIPAQWRTLRNLPLARRTRDDLMNILRLGANVARLLADLHERQIRHGNLAPGSIAFCVPQDAPEKPAPGSRIETAVFLKNAWLRHTRPGRCTDRRYGAPEERIPQEPIEELKADCWGLGVILFELATGAPPFGGQKERPSIRQRLGAGAPPVPDALERVVRDCLAPDPRLRPPADQVWHRLLVAEEFDGRFLRVFEADLWTRLCVGQRLFAIWTQSSKDLDSTLDALEFRGCDIYVMQEDAGVIQRSSGHCIARWRTAGELHRAATAELRSYGLPDPPPPTREEVVAYNGMELLTDSIDFFRGRRKASHLPPVLVALGNAWWDSGPPRHQIAIRRLLRLCQDEYSTPVEWADGGERTPKPLFTGPAVILADAYLSIDAELAPAFHWMIVPPLTGAEIFDRVLSAPATLDVPEVSESEAAAISKLMFPCTARELSSAMQECALRYGKIDRRVAEVWDELREERFREAGSLTFIPMPRLPQLDAVGLPLRLRARIEEWTRAMTSLVRDVGGANAPRRLLIEGGPGYGKTTLALSLGRRLERPVLRLEIGQCLQRDLGASETFLRKTLAAASSVAGAVVLLDDGDRVFTSAGAADATLARMSGVFLHWIDNMPPSLTLVVTATRATEMEPQWLRRMQLRIHLDHPFTLADVDYRSEVFAAAFRRHGLKSLASAPDFVAEMANGTNPHRQNPPKLHSPDALAIADTLKDAEGSPLAAQTVRLATPADIEHWVNDTLQLRAGHDPVETPDFWRSQLR